MSLLSDFREDLETVFFDPTELAPLREVAINDGTGKKNVRKLSVLWTENVLHDHKSILGSAAYAEADACMTIAARDLPHCPAVDETIYSPADSQWVIRKVENVLNLYYRLYLKAAGGQ